MFATKKALDQAENDCVTMALRLMGEDDDTFAPETREVMERWKPKCMVVLAGGKIEIDKNIETEERRVRGGNYNHDDVCRVLELLDMARRSHLKACQDNANTNEENRLLEILLQEWFDMFYKCRSEGTEGADLIDRTGFILNVCNMTARPPR